MKKKNPYVTLSAKPIIVRKNNASNDPKAVRKETGIDMRVKVAK